MSIMLDLDCAESKIQHSSEFLVLLNGNSTPKLFSNRGV